MAAATEPIPASSLWTSKTSEATPGKQRLGSKCKAIDAALHGGLDYGCVTCISAEPDSGARDITQALLVSHLLGSKDSTATVIDTGQAVDVRQLYHALLADSPQDGKEDAKAALNRVKLMKTFDFEGLTEGLSELRAASEGRVPPHERPPRGTVADSQDDGGEMLDAALDASAPPPKPQTTSVLGDAASPSKAGGGLLLIDNITQLAAPLLKTNHGSGQALITSFMRSLAHLTKTYTLCTITMNSTISPDPKNQAFYNKQESPSAFASCTIRPALGKTWTYLVDVHLLVHRMPKTGKDAKVVYAGQRDGDPGELVSVVEVVQDRYGGRVGRWIAFEVGDGGKLSDVM